MRYVFAPGVQQSVLIRSCPRAVSLGIIAVLVIAGPALAGVSRDAGGWTVVTPAADSRTVYVSSSSGDDGNSGLSSSQPVASLSRAKSLLRDRSADQLLLKRGDVWNNQSFGEWELRGRSASEPMVIGAYGTGDRPRIQTGTQNGMTVWNQSVGDYGHLVIQGLHFQANRTSGTTQSYGIRWDRPGENLLIEDTMIQGYKDNISIMSVVQDTPFRNLQIRRSVIVDAFGAANNGVHAQGVYTSNVRGILIEENVLHHNGWNTAVNGAIPSQHNHNLYIQGDSGDLTVRGNVIASAAANGLQARPGGTVERNLFVDNGIGFFIAGSGGIASDNVVLHGSTRPLWPDYNARAWGIDMANVEGSEALRNIIAHTPGGSNALTGLGGVISLDNIIYQWGNQTTGTLPGGATPSLASYESLITGGALGSLDDFLAGARLQSRNTWDNDYLASAAVDYFQQGFGLVTHAPEPQGLALLLLGAMALRRRRQRI